MNKNVRASLNEAQKFSLIKREAIYTGLALVGLIIFWLIAGFGMSNIDLKIFHVPIWAICGILGVWFFAICISFILSRILFKEIDLEGENHD